MKFFNRLQKYALYTLACSTFIVSSCKKEYETIKKPYNEIRRFAIAGYAGLDSLHASVVNDQIVVNWSATAPQPEKVKPVISVSSGATIAPVSGTEVEFKDGVSYTVTAEDGTERIYKLKIKRMEAIPKLLAVSPATGLSWIDFSVLNLTGEYFLAGGGAANIKVYLQRKKDGVEVDLPLVETLLRQTTMRVNMPAFTLASDTGWHKIWLKVGNEASQGIDTYIAKPMLRNATTVATFAQKGQALSVGQTLTINYNITDNYGGGVTRYYKGKFNSVWFSLTNGSINPSFEATIQKVTDNEITFTIPASAAVYSGFQVYSVMAFAPRPIPTAPDARDQFAVYLTNTQTTIQ